MNRILSFFCSEPSNLMQIAEAIRVPLQPHQTRPLLPFFLLSLCSFCTMTFLLFHSYLAPGKLLPRAFALDGLCSRSPSSCSRPECGPPPRLQTINQMLPSCQAFSKPLKLHIDTSSPTVFFFCALTTTNRLYILLINVVYFLPLPSRRQSPQRQGCS